MKFLFEFQWKYLHEALIYVPNVTALTVNLRSITNIVKYLNSCTRFFFLHPIILFILFYISFPSFAVTFFLSYIPPFHFSFLFYFHISFHFLSHSFLFFRNTPSLIFLSTLPIFCHVSVFLFLHSVIFLLKNIKANRRIILSNNLTGGPSYKQQWNWSQLSPPITSTKTRNLVIIVSGSPSSDCDFFIKISCKIEPLSFSRCLSWLCWKKNANASLRIKLYLSEIPFWGTRYNRTFATLMVT